MAQRRRDNKGRILKGTKRATAMLSTAELLKSFVKKRMISYRIKGTEFARNQDR